MTTTNTNNVSDLYACLPLPRQSRLIRVLDIHEPSWPDDNNGSIRCDLRVINLDSESCPSFAALSYVWGIEAAEGHFITCGGCTLGVTPNCHSALRHLREQLGNFTIWVDAICINQKDEGEKTNQISLMEEIYSRAETMYVWLGEGNAATNRAMDYLKTAGYLKYFFRHGTMVEEEVRVPRFWAAMWSAFTACYRLPIGDTLSSNHDRSQALPNIGRLDSGGSPGAAHVSYQDMSELLDRDWIKRIWTYQEILLAFNPVVVCGGFHLPWARFSLGVTFLEYSGLNYQDDNPMVVTLNTWAKTVSARDHLVSSDATSFANTQSCGRQNLSETTLQKYRKFIIKVSQRTEGLRSRNTLSMVFGFLITLFVLILWISFRMGIGKATIRTTIPSRVMKEATKASSSAAACAVACAASDIAACAKACAAASSAVDSVYSLSWDLANQTSRQSLDRAFSPVFGIFFFAFFVSFIIFLGSAWRKYPRLGPVSLDQSDEIDLVIDLCNRKSKEKKDKAIGVQAVLQKLSKKSLSPIDTAQSLECIYKQLCINLMEVTGSLQFLVPASLNNFHEYPSWVPDWSTDFDSFWLKSTLLSPITATPGSRAHWKLDPRKTNVLTVRGRQLCTVAKCFKFRETFNTYDPSQRKLHLENLRSTLQCQYIFQKGDKTVYSILKQMDGFDGLPYISRRQIHAWKVFMREIQYQDPEILLSALESRDSTIASSCRSSKTILRTQISICNCLARSGRTIFVTNHFHIEFPPFVRRLEETVGGGKSKGETDWLPRRAGFGSHNVRAGDFVVLIAGVSSPLIIRRDTTSTRIVSPAAVQGVMAGATWDYSWKVEDLEEFILS